MVNVLVESMHKYMDKKGDKDGKVGARTSSDARATELRARAHMRPECRQEHTIRKKRLAWFELACVECRKITERAGFQEGNLSRATS
eukprot:6177987-Pleurochrysis_carterae.AAC.1